MDREMRKTYGYCAWGISAFLLGVQRFGDIHGHLSGRWAQIFPPHIYAPNSVKTSLWSHLPYEFVPIFHNVTVSLPPTRAILCIVWLTACRLPFHILFLNTQRHFSYPCLCPPAPVAHS
jgi:hypothetical protein